MKSHLLLALVSYLGLAAGCSDDEPKPAAPAAPTVGARPPVERAPAKLTEEDRAVIAYLDAWEPFQQELGDEFATVRKRVTSTRVDIARRRDSADPEGACEAIHALIERHAAWQRDHALPAPLTVERAFNYESSLRTRHTGKGDDLRAVSQRVSRFRDHRDTFGRKRVFELNQQLENLRCAPRK